MLKKSCFYLTFTLSQLILATGLMTHLNDFIIQMYLL